MYYVYLIKSTSSKDKKYVGYTTDLIARLQKHNEGGSRYTKDHKPWRLISFVAFIEKDKALAFEKYLKSHAGRAFAKKRFW